MGLTNSFKLQKPNMTASNLHVLATNIVEGVCRDLSDFRTKSSFTVSEKDIKSKADVFAHERICVGLEKTSIPVFSEESSEKVDFSEKYWVLDPIDGTSNYEAGFGPSTVSLALYSGARCVSAVVREISTGEVFELDENGIVLRNKVEFTPKGRSGQNVLYTGIPLNGAPPWETLNLNGFDKVRMLGCASYSILLVASRIGTVYFEDGIRFWDVAAAIAIADATGCRSSLANDGGLDGPLRVKVEN